MATDSFRRSASSDAAGAGNVEQVYTVTSKNLKNYDRHYYEKKVTTNFAVRILMVYNIRIGHTHYTYAYILMKKDPPRICETCSYIQLNQTYYHIM